LTKLLKPTLFIACFSCLGIIQAQSIPKIGHNTSLEIGNWNLEWFGKTSPGYGPSNDTLQQRLIANCILASDLDLWALCEVSDAKAFDTLCRRLPQYTGIICNYTPEQKTALLFKKNLFQLVSAKLLGLNNKDSFSTARYPFEIVLKTIQNSSIDTIKLLILHLKANTGTDSLKLVAYNSRKRSAEWLKDYINLQAQLSKTIILGDWNDDIDQSIYNNLPTPFTSIISSNKGQFISKYLSDLQEATTTSYPETIDHQWVSNGLYQYWIKDSIHTWRLNQFIPNYAQVCSDHYPVYSKYEWHTQKIQTNTITNVKIYPNPCYSTFEFSDMDGLINWQLINRLGQVVLEASETQISSVNLQSILPDCYTLKIKHSSGYSYIKLIKAP
jgi:hypothetical protein